MIQTCTERMDLLEMAMEGKSVSVVVPINIKTFSKYYTHENLMQMHCGGLALIPYLYPHSLAIMWLMYLSLVYFIGLV